MMKLTATISQVPSLPRIRREPGQREVPVGEEGMLLYSRRHAGHDVA